MSWRFYICILVVIELQKKLLTNKQKLGIYVHPLGLSVGKKGLGLEGLMESNIQNTVGIVMKFPFRIFLRKNLLYFY